MAVVGRLTDSGELKLTGKVDTRLPMVTDGLVAHHPMDGTTKGTANLNLIDYSTWVIGSLGSQTGFPQLGDGNSIVEELGPFGESQAIWQTLDNDVDSGPDGGWNSTTFGIDATKKYRFSTWVKRAVLGDGTFYLGTHGFGTTDGIYDHSLGGGATLNTNPYFTTSSMSADFLDTWLLVVGYVWPHDNTDYTDMPDNGYYEAFSTVRKTHANDFRWHASSASSRHRSYLYYSTLPETHQLWAYPRVDLVDGTEPSLEDLVNGEGNVTNSSTDTNTTLTPIGVGVEQLTTNIQSGHPKISDITLEEGLYQPGWNNDLHTNAIAQGGTGWNNGYNAGADPTNVLYHAHWIYDNEHNGICMLFRHEASPVTGAYPGWLGITRNSVDTAATHGITDNMDVTVSWLQKTSNLSKPARVGLYHWREIEDSNGFETNIGSGFNTKVDEWERVSYTSNTGTNWDLTKTFNWYVYGHYSATGTVMVRDVQLELRNYATSFTETSRATGTLELPFTQVPPYTIQFKHKSTWPIANQVDQSTYPYILQLGDYYANASISFWNYAFGLKTYIKGDTSGVWTAITTHYSYNAGNWDNVEHDYALVAVNNTTFKVYIDGVDSGVSTVSTEDVTNISVLKLGYVSGVANAIFRDFSIYDRALTTDEIVKNAKGTHSITANGLITKQIKERPAIDNSSQHFPFGTDNKSNWNAIKTVTETNTVYENDGVFVGTGTTNLLLLPLIDAIDLTGGKLIKEDLGDGKVRFSSTDGTNVAFRLRCAEADLIDGDTYAVQISYLNNTGTLSSDWCDTAVTYKSDSERTANSGTLMGTGSRATYDNTYRFFDLNGVTPGTIMYNAQVEHRDFTTAFVDYYTTRAQTNLHLPYYTINCKADFTIYGWWYPKQAPDGVAYKPCLTRNTPNANAGVGDRILIMNADTSTRQLRGWHGSDGITESVVTITSGIEIKDNEWNFFCLKRDGADMKLFLGNSDGFASATTATAYQLDTDAALTQAWQVGEYSNQESNAYHKDYVFQQNAITDADIEQIFKRKMKATTDGLIIQNKVGPGKTL